MTDDVIGYVDAIYPHAAPVTVVDQAAYDAGYQRGIAEADEQRQWDAARIREALAWP